MVLAQAHFRPQGHLERQSRGFRAIDLFQRACGGGVDGRFLQHLGIQLVHQQIDRLLINGGIAVVSKNDLIGRFPRSEPRDLAALGKLASCPMPGGLEAIRLHVNNDLGLMIILDRLFEFQCLLQ